MKVEDLETVSPRLEDIKAEVLKLEEWIDAAIKLQLCSIVQLHSEVSRTQVKGV